MIRRLPFSPSHIIVVQQTSVAPITNVTHRLTRTIGSLMSLPQTIEAQALLSHHSKAVITCQLLELEAISDTVRLLTVVTIRSLRSSLLLGRTRRRRGRRPIRLCPCRLCFFYVVFPGRQHAASFLIRLLIFPQRLKTSDRITLYVTFSSDK